MCNEIIIDNTRIVKNTFGIHLINYYDDDHFKNALTHVKIYYYRII